MNHKQIELNWNPMYVHTNLPHVRMPGGLLRKPPLKCARTCPAWLAYPLGMLTQHGYVAPH